MPAISRRPGVWAEPGLAGVAAAPARWRNDLRFMGVRPTGEAHQIVSPGTSGREGAAPIGNLHSAWGVPPGRIAYRMHRGRHSNNAASFPAGLGGRARDILIRGSRLRAIPEPISHGTVSSQRSEER